jgi:hypothetical protein
MPRALEAFEQAVRRIVELRYAGSSHVRSFGDCRTRTTDRSRVERFDSGKPIHRRNAGITR